jgi:hypothetical protein
MAVKAYGGRRYTTAKRLTLLRNKKRADGFTFSPVTTQ